MSTCILVFCSLEIRLSVSLSVVSFVLRLLSITLVKSTVRAHRRAFELHCSQVKSKATNYGAVYIVAEFTTIWPFTTAIRYGLMLSQCDYTYRAI